MTSSDDNKSIDTNDNLDIKRGEELYKNFGFDQARPSGEENINDLVESTDQTSIIEKDLDSPVPTKILDQNPKANKTHKLNKNSKLTIQADHGDIIYNEENLWKTYSKKEASNDLIANDNIEIIEDEIYYEDIPRSKSLIDLTCNLDNSHNTADYELPPTYFGEDGQVAQSLGYSYYLSDGSISPYSIKDHYKAKASDKKKSLPIGKIGLGLVLVAGVLLYLNRD